MIDSADVLERALRDPGSLTTAERFVFVLIEFETRMEMDGWDDFFTSRWSRYYPDLKMGLAAAGDRESLEVLEDYECHLRERNVGLDPGAIDSFLVAQNDEYFKRCRDWRDDYRHLSEERWQKVRASLRALGFELQI